MAEREGFEPSVRVTVHTLSRRALSTAQAPLQIIDLQRCNSLNQKVALRNERKPPGSKKLAS